jgi:N-acetyl-anhydromuramoyl-L-alanine amidase
MLVDNHLLAGANHIASPNFDDRPNAEVSLLVIHCISLPPGEFGNDCITALFCNRLDPEAHPYFMDICQLTVSAHLLIKRTGEVVQYVPFDKRAWHAGKSCYQGRERCNDFSIGIELEGTEFTPYSNEQYEALRRVTNSLLASYPSLSKDRIAGHSDIAPGRKTDPGDSFDWNRFYRLLD